MPVKRDGNGRFIKGHSDHLPKKDKRLRCSICDKPTMSRYPSQIKDNRGKYCSKECFYIGSKGQRRSVKTEFKKGEKIGSVHPNWKGGVTSENEKFRKTPVYKIWRDAVFGRDYYTCQKCGEKGGYLHAHHIKPFALFPESRLDITNGKTLCKKCHRETETYGNRLRKVI